MRKSLTLRNRREFIRKASSLPEACFSKQIFYGKQSSDAPD